MVFYRTEKEKERPADQRHFRGLLLSMLCVLAAAAVLVLLAALFFPVLRVTGSSMEPTLKDQDIIILARTENIETGELIGFYDQNKILLKRVIAGPGDRVDIDSSGIVSVNGELLDEPYVTDPALGETDRTYPYQVPDEQYFVLGDNRLSSLDSRSSVVGCIGPDQIIGQVILRVWPGTGISLIR